MGGRGRLGCGRPPPSFEHQDTMTKELTYTQLAYLEWRANPERQPPSKVRWGEENGVSTTTLRAWEKQPWFRQGLERRLAELNVEPDRVQEVLDALWREAKGGDVSAAREYFKAIEDLRPPRPTVEDVTVMNLTDDELEVAWEEGLAALKRQRALT